MQCGVPLKENHILRIREFYSHLQSDLNVCLGCNVCLSFLVCCFNITANFRQLLFLSCSAFLLQEPLSTASTFEDPQYDVKVSHSTLFACSCMFFKKTSFSTQALLTSK